MVRRRRVLTAAAIVLVVLLLVAQYLVSFSGLPDWNDFRDYSATSNTTTASYPTTTVVAYITYGDLEDGREWRRFRTTVLDALDTWLASDPTSRIFYVVNEMWRDNYKNVCNGVKSNVGKNCDRVVPIFVDCGDNKKDVGGKSRCCTMDKGLRKMYQDYPHFDFYVYHDDDMYFRTDCMRDFLSGVPRDKIFVSSHRDMVPLGITFNDEKHQHCSDDKDFIYSWGQPVVYSNAGLRFMVDHVFQYEGVTEQCTVFDVTHHVGNAIVHWMSMMPLLRLPPVEEITTSKNGEYREDVVAFHAVGKDDNTNYNATGLHEVVRRMGYKKGPYDYVWHEPRGYKTTSTFHKFGAVENWTTWHSMPVSDCKGPNYGRKAKQEPTRSETGPEDSINSTAGSSYPTVAYITYGYLKPGHEWRFRKMVLDALDTWLASDPTSRIFYVVNEMWRGNYNKFCGKLKSNVGRNCDRVVPIFVDCEEGYYGKSPCCKMDKGLQKMYEEYPHFDFYVYHDDDMYFRTEYMRDFLRGVSSERAFVTTYDRKIRLGISFSPKDHQHCSKDDDFVYPWGQPAIYSNAGLRFMVDNVFKHGGVLKQCTQFRVTHDVGNAIVHWMTMLPHLRLPPVKVSSKKNVYYGDELIAYHAVGKNDEKNYNLTGIHKLVKGLKHEYLRPYRYEWHEPTGFMTTETYHRFGNVSNWTEWHTMPVSDCRGPKYGKQIRPLGNGTEGGSVV